jgi:Ca2+-binding RTX toxin-like protein
MSAALDASGMLVVRGTSASDHIVVTEYTTRAFSKLGPLLRHVFRVVHNGQTELYSELTGVKGIAVYGDDGDDFINIEGSKLPCRVFGGGGKDTIITGSGNDFVAGDNDRDATGAWAETTGAGDADYIDTGAGNDTLMGDAVGDVLRGGVGDDQIEGGAGRDNIDAGAGNDAIFARDGKGGDMVNGGDGFDLVLYDQPGIRHGPGFVVRPIAGDILTNTEGTIPEGVFVK